MVAISSIIESELMSPARFHEIGGEGYCFVTFCLKMPGKATFCRCIFDMFAQMLYDFNGLGKITVATDDNCRIIAISESHFKYVNRQRDIYTLFNETVLSWFKATQNNREIIFFRKCSYKFLLFLVFFLISRLIRQSSVIIDPYQRPPAKKGFCQQFKIDIDALEICLQRVKKVRSIDKDCNSLGVHKISQLNESPRVTM